MAKAKTSAATKRKPPGAKKKPARKNSKKKAKKRAPKKLIKPAEMQPQQLPLEGGNSTQELLYPAATIAMLLMISDRRLRQLVQEGLVPKARHGRYPLVGCVQGYVKYLQALKVGTDERANEATRLTKVRADSHELDMQIKKRELYPKAEVDAALFGAATTLAVMLDGTASRISSQLGGGAALRKKLIDEFREIRKQFAAGLREFSGRLRIDGWDSRSATRSTAGRVGKKKPRAAKRKRRARTI